MAGERILIVEDERLIAADIEDHLVDLGYRVAGVAISGEDAIRDARERGPDLILMDVKLRGSLDGTEAARRIRETLEVPIVFLTSHADPATLERACASSPYGYLVKPFEGRELAATIETSLYRHREDQKLRGMERWLATTLMSIGDAVLATDVHGRLTFVNPVAEQFTGWLRHEALGRPSSEVFRAVHGPDRRLLADPVQQALREGVVLQVSNGTVLQGRNGTEVPVDLSAAPIRDEAGGITGVVLIVRDRTERTRAEEERRRMERKLEEAQRLESLGVLAAGIAHDFNNLLTGILGNASIAREEAPLSPSQLERMRAIEEGATRAAELCRQMLAYAGRGKTTTAPIDVNALVGETAQLVKLSFSKRAQVERRFAAALPAVKGDASQLRQVVMNLLMNASEALADAGGRITVTTGITRLDDADWAEFVPVPELPAESYVFVEVEDSGCGMTPDVLSRIFNPFYSTKFTGRGLGLSAVHGILRSHGGAVRVRSEVGRGTTFRVVLPAAAAAAPTSVRKPRSGARAWKDAGLALVVDDDRLVRMAASSMLELLGFEVVEAADGDEVLPLLRDKQLKPRLVLIDLTMVRRHGAETLADVRSVDTDVPVLMMSGYSEQDALVRVGELSCSGFLEKPFSLEHLRDRLAVVLGEDAASRLPPAAG